MFFDTAGSKNKVNIEYCSILSEIIYLKSTFLKIKIHILYFTNTIRDNFMVLIHFRSIAYSSSYHKPYHLLENF